MNIKKIQTLIKLIFISILLSVTLLYCNKYNENAIIIYVYSSFTDNLKDAIANYMQVNHNAEVVFEVFQDTGPMVANLIMNKDNPRADIVIGIDNSFGLEILREDVLLSYTPPNLKLAFEELSFDKTKRLIPYDYGFVTINYDSERLKNIPNNFDDLTNDIYRNNLALMSPETSSTGRIFLLETIARYGVDGYLDFWRSLKPSITNITTGWSDAYYGLYIQGESDMVISYTTSPAAHYIFDNTLQYKSIIFDNKAYIQIEGCGIIKNSKNIELSKKVIDYIISKDFQKLIPENQFMYPINPAVELPESFKISSEIPKFPLILDTELVRDNISLWIEQWKNIILE